MPWLNLNCLKVGSLQTELIGKTGAGVIGSGARLAGSAGTGALVNALAGSPLSPLEAATIAGAIPIGVEGLKSVSGSLGFTSEQIAGKIGIGQVTLPSYLVEDQAGLSEVAKLLPDNQNQLKGIIKDGIEKTNLELDIPKDLSELSASQLKEILVSNPKLFEASGAVFQAVIPKTVLLNDIRNGDVPEKYVDNYLKTQNVDVSDLNTLQKLDALYNFINSQPDPRFLMVRGFTLGGSTMGGFQFTTGDIINALFNASTTPEGAVLIHISPESRLYQSIIGGRQTGILPSETPQNPRSQFATGLSEYQSIPGINQYAREPTTLGYAAYSGAFPYEEPTGAGVGIAGRYYGIVSPFQSYPTDWLERSDFAKQNYGQPDLERKIISYISNTGRIPNYARWFDFFYDERAAEMGKNVHSPVVEYFGKGEYEGVKPLLGTQKGGTSFKITTIEPNQGLFQNVPLLQNLFPEFIKGQYITAYQLPVDRQTVAQRLKVAFPQEFEAITNEHIIDGLNTMSAFSRDRGALIQPTTDGKVILTLEDNGKWGLPGGGVNVDKGEDPKNTAIREAKEELGIKAKNVVKAFDYVGTTQTFSKSGAPYQDNNHIYIADSTSKDITATSKEIHGVSLYDPNNGRAYIQGDPISKIIFDRKI